MMNMVREPVSRLISQFYYLRSLKRWNGKNERPSKQWIEKDFNECVRSGDLECQVGMNPRKLYKGCEIITRGLILNVS